MSTGTPFIRSEPIAKKYELNFHTERAAFELKLRKDEYDFFQVNERTQELLAKTQVSYGVPQWDFKSKDSFGYGKCFKKTTEDITWVSLEARVTKKNDLVITLTLMETLRRFGYPFEYQRAVPGEEEQEMLLKTICSEEVCSYGAAMSADLSAKFSFWLYDQNQAQRDAVNPLIQKAMYRLYKVLYRTKPQGDVGGLRNNGFILQPPTGIYSCQFGILGQDQVDFNRKHRFGYGTFCHNLDNRWQQLVLLAGFTTLCEFFRNSKT